MLIGDGAQITLVRGGSVFMMTMVTNDGHPVLHVDVEAYDDPDRIATISLTAKDSEQLGAFLLEAARVLRDVR